MTPRRQRLLGGILFLLLLASPAFADDVGVVKVSKGAARIERKAQHLPAPVGTKVRVPPWGVPQRALRDLPVRPLADLESEYYLRFMALDRPGVLARIAGVLGRFDISIASVIQKERRARTTVPVVIRTHRARERGLQRALAAIARLPVVRGAVAIRIEERLG